MSYRTVIPAALAVVLLAPISFAGTPQPIGMNYATNHWKNSLELYLPDHGCTPYPLAVYLHGGGWLIGNSSAVVPYLDDMLGRGFAVASVNYRWTNHAPFPAQIHDCKGAVRFLRANAGMFNLDPTRIVAFGESAGGHLAALLGTSHGVASLEGDIGGNLGASSAVMAVADLYGPTDMFELGAIHNADDSFVSRLFNWPIQDIINNQKNPAYADLVALVHSANPATHATSNDPPMHIAHGTADTFVPPSQSQILHDAMIWAGASSTLQFITGGGHDLSPPQLQDSFDFLMQQTGIKIADINCDGAVNANDLLIVINSWGPCLSGNPCAGDINRDGAVNANDLLMVINGWG